VATAQRIRFRTIGLMLFDGGHAKDVPLLGKLFRRRTVFKLLTPKVRRSYRDISFWRKRPLKEKFRNFAMNEFTGIWIHVFLLNFAETGKAEMTKRVRGILSLQKGCYFAPFLCGFWSDLVKIFIESLFLHSPSLCQVLSKSVQFSKEIYPKMSSRLIVISA